MDCLLPHVLDVLAGQAAPLDARIVTPPRPLAPVARADGKAFVAEPLAHHVETANFTIQWSDDALDPARADAFAETLEAAWTALVDVGGWPAPPGADAWLQTVILDPGLGFSGYTTLHETDALPDGVPYMYVDPDYGDAYGEGYARSVAVHELGHALQFALRTTARGGLGEGWFWEASAEWQAELGAPELDTYALSTWWYARNPQMAFDSEREWHEYGMLLLPAWMDEAVGPDALRDAWLAAAGRPEDDWEAILADATGVPLEEAIADMAGAVAARTLREGHLYEPPDEAAVHDEAPAVATLDARGRLGTSYVRVGAAAPGFAVEGDALVRYAALDADGVATGAWGAEAPDGPFLAAITALSEGGEIVYGVGEDAIVEEEAPGGCACAAGAPGGRPTWGAAAVAGALVALLRSRRRAAERRDATA